MKKIGLIITNLVGGGAERVVLNLANMFRNNNIDVHIILLENLISYNIDKLKVHTLVEKKQKKKLFNKYYENYLSNLLDDKLQFLENDGVKFDLVLSNLPATDRIVVNLENKYNIFYIIHTTYSLEIAEFYKKNMFLRAIRRKNLYKQIYYNKHLICVSQGIYDDIVSLGIQPASNRVIYNPFDINKIKKNALENLDNIPNDNYIVHVGAYRKEKRHDILLQAYSKLNSPPKLKLLCDYNINLDNLIKKYNLENSVEVVGFQKNPYPYIKNAKLLVLSSDREGLPSVLIEALALKVPVVSTNCISGPSEILVGKLCNYLADVNNINDLSNKIQKALKTYPTIDDSYVDKFNYDLTLWEQLCIQ